MSTAAAPAASALRCSHCATELAVEQDWCMECGAAATTHIAAAPSWRLPFALALLALAIVAAGIAFALVELL